METDVHIESNGSEDNSELARDGANTVCSSNGSVEASDVSPRRADKLNITEGTPVIKRILQRDAKSPTTPVTVSPPGTPNNKDYRELYHEMRIRVLQVTKEAKAELAQMKTVNEKILAENGDLKRESESLKANHDQLLKEKDDLNDIVTALKAQNQSLHSKCIEVNKRKEGAVKFCCRENVEEFRIKSKAKKSKTPDEELKCEYHDCTNTSEDALIKCNSCSKWICETCSDARITKLKSIMNNCSTVFFACKICVDSSQDTGITVGSIIPPEKDELQTSRISTSNSELISSLKAVLDDKVNEIETKLGSMIESKLKERIPDTGVSGNVKVDSTYASKVLKVPEEVRKIIEDSKNNDKVEESEQEKRARNFVIHGADEYGNTPEKIKKLDTDYVIEILSHLGISQKPESVTRLGNPDDSKKRPVKVVMKTKEDKQKVMMNLRKLKGTIDEFGKISVTEDYTQSEREQLRKWSTDAKKKSADDPKFDYKVRGDPKNGLRLLRVNKK